MHRPRIHFLVDRPRRAQARVARAVSRALSADFRCVVIDAAAAQSSVAEPCDLLVALSWDHPAYADAAAAAARIIKVVDDEDGIDRDGAAGFAADSLDDAALVICPSANLKARLAAHCHARVLPFAVDPFVFPARQCWEGPMRFGWAGLAEDPNKGLHDVLIPAAARAFDLRVAQGDLQLAEMGAFYRSVDVFTLASAHEGAPLTLLEAMASGCFPVCTNVGLVSELVRHGENGLVVERDPEAFHEAFAWCAAHAEQVRRAGAQNAEWMRQRRTWPHVAESWRSVLRETMTTVLPVSPPPAPARAATRPVPVA